MKGEKDCDNRRRHCYFPSNQAVFLAIILNFFPRLKTIKKGKRQFSKEILPQLQFSTIFLHKVIFNSTTFLP
jgi:hypothetical protein